MNNTIIEAHDRHIREAREVINSLERSIIRGNVAETNLIIRGIDPIPPPPVLQRHDNFRRPFADLTNNINNNIN
jgi:hypothetical protein